MKIKRVAASAVTLTAAVGGLALVAGSAVAGPPTITAGAGSSITCNITGKAGLAPTLANDWAASAHSSDVGWNGVATGDAKVTAAVAALPNTTYSVAGPVTTSAKTASTSCSGTVTDGVNTSAVTSVKISSSSTGTNTGPATCSGLASPGSATYSNTVAYKGATAKITGTTITSNLATLADAHGFGFQLTATTITGSFAGGSSVSNAYTDAGTIDAATGAAVDSQNPISHGATGGVSPCEAQLSIKVKNVGLPTESVTASLKKPKGFKKVIITGGLFDGTPSNVAISR